MENFNNSTILIAPLDWGLGHTTRCIPIIKRLQQNNCRIIAAVNARQKRLLEQECGHIEFVDLFGYNISYSSNKAFFILKILVQIPKIFWCINRENQWLKKFILSNKIDAIISDNRYGFYSKKIKSIFITHQLKIKAGYSCIENILQKINYHYINKFTECWVPDFIGENNIAGTLSHPKKLPKTPVKYIGTLSRFEIINATEEIDICVLISGPEPQRTMLEQKLLAQLQNLNHKKIVLMRGLPNCNELINATHIKIISHLQGKDLQQLICNSKLVIARSGYTTIMELIALQKRMILIPTPMQTEQEYLATYLQNKKMCIACNQNNLNITEAIKTADSSEFIHFKKQF